MKKISLFLIFFSVVILVSNFISASSISSDIAYVVKNPNYPDDNFIDVIEDLNLDYKLIPVSQVGTTDFSDYGMILIGDENLGNVPVNDFVLDAI